MKRPQTRKGSLWEAQVVAAGVVRTGLSVARDEAGVGATADLAGLALRRAETAGVASRDAETAAFAVGEAQRAARVRLPVLALRERKSPFLKLIPLLAFAAAATLALVFAWPRPADDDWRVKGGANVRVYRERAGTVTLLTDQRLQEGDRVRAEVDPDASGYAYWLVTDAAGKPLVDAAFVRASEIRLDAGIAGAFEESLGIVGPAVGETLYVVVCPGARLVVDTPEAVLAETRCSSRRLRLR